MPPWFSALSKAQRNESKFDSYSWVQLATIGVNITPRVRTVVFRGWSKSYEMFIYTDKRSNKYHELNLNNNVEICWLFSRSRCQFRFRGKSSIVSDLALFCHWEKLSDNSKSMWSWPSPGDPFVLDRKKDFSVKKQEKISCNFTVLKIDIEEVDQLLLQLPIHTRRRWILNNEWIEERINP
tara:strand:- start:3883 stop:4425 length:543 start_codon:yes stop_codon:yes gene_type:complete